jgi:hypothetical protein
MPAPRYMLASVDANDGRFALRPTPYAYFSIPFAIVCNCMLLVPS